MVKVENDFIMLGNSADWGFLPGGAEYQGDKIFACGGPCWDDPAVGWHECPPGMGIYQDVTIEARRPVHLHDIFVRPLDEQGKAEAWIEVFNSRPETGESHVGVVGFRPEFPGHGAAASNAARHRTSWPE